MIDCGQGAVRSPHFAVGIAKALKRLLPSLLAVASQGTGALHRKVRVRFRSEGSLTGDVTS